ncbi:MAG: aliphatic sulfonate ABC transporter substrate-binding protein [Fibrella sp.]|nr:aliphatic sulfonate ABC transporter substrate-binding protein [Armatimonadota bacterium]
MAVFNNIPLRLLALILLAFVGSGCGQRRHSSGEAGGAFTSPATGVRQVIRIGYQKSGAMDVLRLKGDLEKKLAPLGVGVEWINFAAGPQTLEALAVGSVDFSSMGDAPLIFAQAANIPLVYVANTPPGDGASRAILVPPDSKIRSITDLKGKRIGIQKGTGTHNFLVQALSKGRVPYSAIRPQYLAPADGRVAFESGTIDAWAIWDPYLAAAEQDMKARVIVDGSGIISAGGFYVSIRPFAVNHPEWIRVTLTEIEKASIWSRDHPHEAAVLLAPSMGVSVDKLEAIQKRTRKGKRYIGYRPIDDEVVRTQQEVAENFYRIGLLPRKVDVKTGLLTKEQYAALLPPIDSDREAVASAVR